MRVGMEEGGGGGGGGGRVVSECGPQSLEELCDD